MLDEKNFFPHAAVASMAALTAAANMYNSFYPTNYHCDPVNYFACNETKRAPLDRKVQVNLEGTELWQRFYSLGTEMIITKNGRRLFPTFRISVSELDPATKYMLLLDIVPIDDHRYKYQESAWVISGKAEPHVFGRYFIHPDGPQTGEQWMKQSIVFNKVKITNNPMQNPDQILLNSMHRYVIRLHVIEACDEYSLRTGPLSTFTFDETAFIAVTAYQNDLIKNLKIDNNPFAKGFREPTHGKKNSSKCLKRLQSSLPLNRSPKNDSSLISPSSTSPPMHHPTMEAPPATCLTSEQEHDATQFMYPHPFAYNAYAADPSSMVYNPYASYGYYAANPYSTPFF